MDICENLHGGNPESVAANVRVAPTKERDRNRIFDYVREIGPRICDEVEVALGMTHQTASARITELKAEGRLVLTGERRPTRTGSTAAEFTVAA